MRSNIKNRTFFIGDNLPILRGINSNSIDLIYLDPPFNKGQSFEALGILDKKKREFKDTFSKKDIKKEWLEKIKKEYRGFYLFLKIVKILDPKDFYYLVYISIRIIEIKRILKDTGALYFHCDFKMSHDIKLMLDQIFGYKNFKNEIIWRRSHINMNLKNRLTVVTDSIFYYSKHPDKVYFKKVYVPYSKKGIKEFRYKDDKGYYCRGSLSCLRNRGVGYFYDYKGYPTPRNGYSCKKEKLEKLEKEGLLHIPLDKSKLLYYKIYLKDAKGVQLKNLWYEKLYFEGGAKELIGYPTQKPVALIERIIKLSCPEDGLVLDPFAGSGTTCVAAENLNREWIGIDQNKYVIDMLKKRFDQDIRKTSDFFNMEHQDGHDFIITSKVPKREDTHSDNK